MFVDCRDDVVRLDVDKERINSVPVNSHGDVSTAGMPDIFDVGDDVAQVGLFNTCLDNSSSRFRDLVGQLARDDGGGDGGGCVDDFLDAGNTLSDGHSSNTGKMESLQCHLRTRLTNRLRTNGTNRVPWLDSGAMILGKTEVDELVKGGLRNLGDTVSKAVLLRDLIRKLL